MTPDPIPQRITRARVLADRYLAARDVLIFYAKLVEYQRALLDRWPGLAFDREHIVSAVPPFLDWLEREGPPALSTSAADLRRIALEDWRVWLDRAIAPTPGEAKSGDSVTMFVIEALVQPFAERQAHANLGNGSPTIENAKSADRCPACGHLPVVGVLREEGHGARRSLVCARCVTEWVYARLLCPGCGEHQFEALPVYTAEQFAHIRVEACDRCRRYLKTVDLTKDGLAVPLVDDVASLSLDLWARSQGYERLRPNLMRV